MTENIIIKPSVQKRFDSFSEAKTTAKKLRLIPDDL